MEQPQGVIRQQVIPVHAPSDVRHRRRHHHHQPPRVGELFDHHVRHQRHHQHLAVFDHPRHRHARVVRVDPAEQNQQPEDEHHRHRQIQPHAVEVPLGVEHDRRDRPYPRHQRPPHVPRERPVPHELRPQQRQEVVPPHDQHRREDPPADRQEREYRQEREVLHDRSPTVRPSHAAARAPAQSAPSAQTDPHLTQNHGPQTPRRGSMRRGRVNRETRSDDRRTRNAVVATHLQTKSFGPSRPLSAASALWAVPFAKEASPPTTRDHAAASSVSSDSSVSFSASHRSASIAALQPIPAAVTACR